MNAICYPASLEMEGGRCLAQFVDLEEAHTFGVTREDALVKAAEVLSLTLQARLEEEMDIPAPSSLTVEQVHKVAPAADVQAYLLSRCSYR